MSAVMIVASTAGVREALTAELRMTRLRQGHRAGSASDATDDPYLGAPDAMKLIGMIEPDDCRLITFGVAHSPDFVDRTRPKGTAFGFPASQSSPALGSARRLSSVRSNAIVLAKIMFTRSAQIAGRQWRKPMDLDRAVLRVLTEDPGATASEIAVKIFGSPPGPGGRPDVSTVHQAKIRESLKRITRLAPSRSEAAE